jgi:hypothetical protein
VTVLLSLVPWKFTLVLLKNCSGDRCCGDGSPVTEVPDSVSIVVLIVPVELTGAVENAESCCSKSAVVVDVPGVSVIGFNPDVGSCRGESGGVSALLQSCGDLSVGKHGQCSPEHSWLKQCGHVTSSLEVHTSTSYLASDPQLWHVWCWHRNARYSLFSVSIGTSFTAWRPSPKSGARLLLYVSFVSVGCSWMSSLIPGSGVT